MGSLLNISCQKCNYERDFQVGKGMLYGELNSYLIESNISSKQMQHEIMALKEQEIKQENCYKAILRCEKCDGLYERFYVTVQYAKGTYKTRYKCPKCNKIMKLVELEEADKLVCPKCHENHLVVSEISEWD